MTDYDTADRRADFFLTFYLTYRSQQYERWANFGGINNIIIYSDVRLL